MTDLFLRLVNMSIAASWIVLVVAALRLVLRKAPKWSHCLMWSMVGLRLVMPFSLKSIFSLVPRVEVQDIPYLGSQTIQAPPPAAGVPAGTVPSTPATPIVPTSPADPIPAADQLPDLMTVLAVVWLVGCAVLLAYGIFCYLRLYRRVSASLHLGDDIFICDDIASPFLLGILHPRVYLPSGIPDEQVPYILAHERAHRSRKDHLWKLLGFVLLAVYWFNPVMWLAYSLFCRDIELACDEMVIRKMGRGDKRAYSQALLSCAAPRRTILISPLAFGEVGIKKRIRTVLSYKRPAFWITLAAVAACVVVAVCFLTDPYAAEDEPLDTANDRDNIAVSSGGGSSEDTEASTPSIPSIPSVPSVQTVPATIAYPELVPEELAASPLYVEALSRPSAVLYHNYQYDSLPQAVTDRAAVDAFLKALERGEVGELYLYIFYESLSLQNDQEYSVFVDHFLTSNGEVRVESDFLYNWEGPLELSGGHSAQDVYLSDYGYFVYHINGNTFPSGHPVVNLREIFPDYEELTRLLDTYVYPLDYTAIGEDDWDWPGRPPSNWLYLFESFYAHETGRLPHEDYGDDFPVEEMTATVNRYFDGVTRQMVITSNFRATYNAATDTLHYVGGRGGAPDPVRVTGWERDGVFLTIYYESYDRDTGIPYDPRHALTVELMEDGSFRYRSCHPTE